MDRQGLLADFVREQMNQKGLSSYDVARRSKGRITAGTVIKILNKDVWSSSIETIQALAVGLDVPENDVLRVARGLPLKGSDTIYDRLADHFNAYDIQDTEWQFLLANMNDMIAAFRIGKAQFERQAREKTTESKIAATIEPGEHIKRKKAG